MDKDKFLKKLGKVDNESTLSRFLMLNPEYDKDPELVKAVSGKKKVLSKNQ